MAKLSSLQRFVPRTSTYKSLVAKLSSQVPSASSPFALSRRTDAPSALDGKDILDRVLASVALVSLLPLLLVIALSVRLDSKGPAQSRGGDGSRDQPSLGRDGGGGHLG